MLKDIAPKGQATSIRRARRLRLDMTLPEILLWQRLRLRPAGLKFRRQHPAGPYILDFFCSDARLAIEVDGEFHVLAERARHDAVRDAYFGKRGITTVRVPASEVFRAVDTVVAGIVASALARLPLHHPAVPGGPPPRAELGEE